MNKLAIYFLLLTLICSSCQMDHSLSSPNGELQIHTSMDENGQLLYAVSFNGKRYIKPSKLGIAFANADDLTNGFEIIGSKKERIRQDYEMQWGLNQFITSEHNQLTLHLKNTETGRKIDIIFRAANDGFAFRYDIPEQKEKALVVSNEHSEFNFDEDS